ncbi:MAG: hypothetical protein ACTIJ9_05960 [Aequorivita sp.]
MKSNLFSLLVIFMLLISACSKDDSKSNDQNFQSTCESDYDSIPGTKCCLEGPKSAMSNEIISVTYFSNIENALYKWEVLGGTMVLVEGENSSTAKFRVGKNFTQDTILGDSYSLDGVLQCSDIIIITSDNK